MAEKRQQSSKAGNVNQTVSVKNTESMYVSKQTSDILSREEEYKRLNAELEAKTASLVQEAEMVMRQQETTLAKPSLLDNISTEDFLQELDNGVTDVGSKGTRQVTLSRPHSKASNSSRQASGKRPLASGKKKARQSAAVADDVAVPDDTFMTSLQQQFSDMSGRLGQDDTVSAHDGDDDDILPQAASDMGSEAVIRFLKAKLRVMQEEMDRLTHENQLKEEENHVLNQKLKEIEEERNRLLRTSSAQQQQIDKHKKLSEEARTRSENLESQLSALKKDLDQTKRSQKKQQTSQSATEVRLNRALEEIEKYREQLLQAKSTSKDSQDSDKKRLEQLLADNKRLEKQKNELMAGFKKQMKLIDVLKRQKMHIEAAKMLQFTEEEFIRALEWGS
ncbi:unnamed protein product [Candidula unifasciata]|uniref:Testis expressed 9 n=1 Tax=Candidula unifasciata TaxID=100452 RepID=A0A8S3ZC29_9EUPU|nr:unnamed protein product [Candidula unifasciata]